MDRKRRLMENNNGWPLRSQLLDGAPFRLPLTNTAVPASAAAGTAGTFTRATSSTWRNNDGNLVTGLSGEIGFVGARRIDNLIRLGAAQSSTLAVAASVTMTLPSGAYQFSMGAGTGTATFSGTGGATGTLAASASARTFVAKTISAGTLIVTGSVATLVDIQVVSMVAETDQTTIREYVSVGVASAPYYHGSFVDGVKCFATDINGSPIPSTTLLGYQAEGARTNLCLQSQDFATTWTPVDANTSVSTNAAIAPDGTLTADKIQEATTANVIHYVTQTTAATAAAHTYSIYLKAAERTWAVIQLTAGASNFYRTVNLSTGALGTTTDGASTSTVTALPNSWYRVTITGTMAAINAIARVWPTNGDSISAYAGTVNSGIYAWGAQVELGSFATSYIPTTTIAVARNQDSLSYPIAGNFDGTNGWVYAEVTTIANNAAGNNYFVGNSGGGPALLYANGTDGRIVCYDGTSAAIKTGIGTYVNNIRKVAATWGGSTQFVTGSGLAPASAAFDGNFGISNLQPGLQTASSAWGTIRNLYVGQRKLSTSELQAITQ